MRIDRLVWWAFGSQALFWRNQSKQLILYAAKHRIQEFNAGHLICLRGVLCAEVLQALNVCVCGTSEQM